MAEGALLAHDSRDPALQCGYRTSGKQGVANALRRVVNYGTLSLSDLPSLFSEGGRHRASLPVTGTVTGQPGCLWSVIPGFLCHGGVWSWALPVLLRRLSPLLCLSSFFFWGGGLFEPDSIVLRAFAQGSLLAVLGGSYWVLGIEPRSASCKASSQFIVVSLQSPPSLLLSLSYLPTPSFFV